MNEDLRKIKLLVADTKECKLDGKKCGHNSFCFKNEGSYRCKCKTGFKSANGDGKDCAGKKILYCFYTTSDSISS